MTWKIVKIVTSLKISKLIPKPVEKINLVSLKIVRI